MMARSRPDSYTMRRILATVLRLADEMGHAGTDEHGRPWAHCVACLVPATVGLGAADPDRFELGHVIPHSADGSFKPDNVVPLCRACNIAMGNVVMTDLLTLRYDTRPLWNGTLDDDPGAPKPYPPREWLPPTIQESAA